MNIWLIIQRIKTICDFMSFHRILMVNPNCVLETVEELRTTYERYESASKPNVVSLTITNLIN